LRRLIAELPIELRSLMSVPSAADDVDTREALAQARRRFKPDG
jgi:hypothetical protein